MRAGDLLPASLQQMDVGEINSVQRLVGLTALRKRITLLLVFLSSVASLQCSHIRARLACHHC
jgi:hypothetical protein